MKAQHVLDAPGESQESFAALSAAVHPAWHQAILRLADVAERVCERLDWVLDHHQDNDPSSEYARNCRELVDMMLEYLDGIDPDPDLEPTYGGTCRDYREDECEPSEDAEPSLGSFNRMTNQDHAYRQSGWHQPGSDLELDDCDREVDDPDEAKQQAPEMCPCA